MIATVKDTVGTTPSSSNLGNCWLLYAKPEHAGAKWLEEVSVGSYAFWLHGTDAHTKTIKPGDTAIIYIASDEKNAGYIHCLGIIPFIREPFIYDKERGRQRIAVMITHDFRNSPIEWFALVKRANENLDAAEAYSGNLSPVRTSGAVHSVAPPIQRALAEYVSTPIPLTGYEERFNPELLWSEILKFKGRFSVFPNYVTAAARRKGEVKNLKLIEDFDTFASMVFRVRESWPKISANASLDFKNERPKEQYASPLDDKESAVDHLDREHIVQSIQATILRDRDSNYEKLAKSATNHLIVGLFGDWGSGKSTIVNLLEQRLTKGSLIEVIKFNAWRESHSQHMSASLVQFIINSLFAKLGFFSRSILTVSTWVKISRPKLGADLLFTLLFIILCLFLAAFATDGFNKPPSEFDEKLALPASVIGCIASLAFYGKKLFGSNYLISTLRQASTQPNFDKHIGIGCAMKESLSAVLDLYGRTSNGVFKVRKNVPQKYVIVIDDLDRCSDRVIVQTLEAAQLIVDIESVTVIFAVDFKILIRAVANNYLNQLETLSSHEAFELARHYLGKLFQISITLSEPNKAALANFVRKRIFELYEHQDENPEQQKCLAENIATSGSKGVDDKTSTTTSNTNKQSVGEGRDIGSGDFLETNELEYQQFVDCASAFSITNPRSLVRLYNVIAFSKSSEPLLIDDEEALKLMLFIAFYWEQLTVKSTGITEAKNVFSNAATFILHAKQHPLSSYYDFSDLDESSIELLLKALRTYAMPIYDLPELTR